MATTTGRGLHYFTVDVDILQDPKFSTLYVKTGGSQWIGVWLELNCIIYRNEGYFVLYDGATADQVIYHLCRTVTGVSPAFVKMVVNLLLHVSYFDEGLYKMTGALTSRGIQKRWLGAKYTRKKPDLEGLPYWLLDDGDVAEVFKNRWWAAKISYTHKEDLVKKINQNEDLEDGNAQFGPYSKVKESKVKEYNNNYDNYNKDYTREGFSEDGEDFKGEPPTPPAEETPEQHFIRAWNSWLPVYGSRLKPLTAKDEKKVHTILTYTKDEQKTFAEMAMKSPYLNGRTKRRRTPAAAAFLFEAETIEKVMRGEYDE